MISRRGPIFACIVLVFGAFVVALRLGALQEPAGDQEFSDRSVAGETVGVTMESQVELKDNVLLGKDGQREVVGMEREGAISARLSISVENQDAERFPGISVSVWVGRYNPLCAPDFGGVTDRFGVFDVLGIGAGPAWFIADGAPMERVRISPGESKFCKVTVEALDELKVLVVDDLQRPVGGACIYNCQDASTDFVKKDDYTNQKGEAVLQGRLLGLRVVAMHREYLPSNVVAMTSTILEKGRLVLVLGDRNASGLLCSVYLDNRPVPGANVRLSAEVRGQNLRSVTGTTDSDGNVEFVGMSEGGYGLNVRAYGSGIATATTPLVSGRMVGCRVDLVPGGVLQGRVVNDIGVNKSGIEVHVVQYRSGPFPTLMEKTVTDLKGLFKFEELPGGKTKILAINDSRDEAGTVVDVVEGGVVDVELKITSGVKISGKLVGTDGKPLIGYLVGVPTTKGASHWAKSTTTEGEGQFTLKNVSHGPVIVEVRTPLGGWGPKVLAQTVQGGDVGVVLCVDVAKVLSCSVVGQVVMDDGGDHGGFTLVLQGSDRGSDRKWKFTPMQDALDLREIAEGKYSMRIRAANAVPYSKPVTLTEEGRLDVGIVTLRASGSIAFTVSGDHGQEQRVGIEGGVIGGVGLEFQLPVHEPRGLVGNLSPGSYRVKLMIDGKQKKSAEVIVAARATSQLEFHLE